MTSPNQGYNSMGKIDQAKRQMENATGGLHTAVGQIARQGKARQGKAYFPFVNDLNVHLSDFLVCAPCKNPTDTHYIFYLHLE